MSDITVVDDRELTLTELNDEACTIVIKSWPDCDKASELLKRIAEAREAAKAELQPQCEAAHTAWKKTVEMRDRNLDPYDDLAKRVKAATAVFMAAEEEKQKKEVARLQAEALAKEQADRERHAKELRAQGKEGKAEARDLLSQPLIAPIIAPPPLPKVAGISSGKKYTYIVTDERLIPREYLMVNPKTLQSAVTSQRDLCAIPGIQVVIETTVKPTGRRK